MVGKLDLSDLKGFSDTTKQVNTTSGLQVHSVAYRFHPSIKWEGRYPNQNQIVGQVERLWRRYHLEEKTNFNTKIEKVYRDEKDTWVLNTPAYGHFDEIIAAIGTCGDPKMPHLPGQEDFKGKRYHSFNLDGKDVKGKKVLIIGEGASAMEALEWSVETSASQISVFARSDKRIIPRNAFVDMLLAFNVFGMETLFSWIPDMILRGFYRDLKAIGPADQGLSECPSGLRLCYGSKSKSSCLG